MKGLIFASVMAIAAVANAGLWEGITDENYVGGPKITERDLLGKVVLYFVMNANESTEQAASRIQSLYKSFDNKRFCVLGSWAGDKDAAAAVLAKLKTTFPVYKGAKLAADTTKRDSGSSAIVSPFGKVLAATTMHGGLNKDHEQILVEAISAVGLPPNIIPGVTLDKYKALKTKLKLGVNLKSDQDAREGRRQGGEEDGDRAGQGEGRGGVQHHLRDQGRQIRNLRQHHRAYRRQSRGGAQAAYAVREELP